mmetsp:Transcript_1646/g.4599  ORF Transcript_1646/g.4599 Transcript_1646/m.4599 type:complete len:326 (+) Transcript_1646:2543-3520(+)
MAVRLVREDHLDVVLCDALVRELRVVLLDLRQGRQRLAVLERADHGLGHGLHAKASPKPHLVQDVEAQPLLHEVLVELLGLVALRPAIGMQPLREEDPLVRELRDHEREIRVHAIALRGQRHVTESGLVVGAHVVGVLLLRASAEELHGGDHHLVVSWNDLCERRDGAGVKVNAGERVRGLLHALGIDPLEGLKEERQALCGEEREAGEVDWLLFPLPVRERRLAVEADAGGLQQPRCLFRAHEGLGEEALDHNPPDVLPARAEGALEQDRLLALVLPQIDRQRGVLQVVQVPLVAHHAADDRGGQVKDEVDVHEAAQNDKPPAD